MIRKYAEIFCWRNVSSFCSAKATHIFSAKIIRILCIESARTVNETALNKLVKLTTLWITGPTIFQVRAALKEAEKELESECYWMAPTDLQHWLQYTFELEQQHFTAKQQAAQKQFGSAKEAVSLSCRAMNNIALDKMLISAEKYGYFSYFPTKTYVVGTH